ncbi:GrpE protein-like protein [Forsythia ovata]|uniref:GrpE protein homolog n=1 Tax=Forsythia ovata TaxID=205694 RepID=A0ABD1U4Y9_9LAMI
MEMTPSICLESTNIQVSARNGENGFPVGGDRRQFGEEDKVEWRDPSPTVNSLSFCKVFFFLAVIAMAAPTLSFYTSLSLSKPTKFLDFQQGRSHFFNPSKPFTKRGFSSFPFLNSFNITNNNCVYNEDPIFIDSGCRNRRRSFFKTSVSAQQDSEPQQTNHDSADSNEFRELEDKATLKPPSNLMSLMQVYREAILNGDGKTKVSDLSAEISYGKEKYIRLQADFDNHRKRSEKERLRLRSDVQGEVIESLLPMVDSFERAKQQIKLETEKEKKIDTSYQGIYKQFVEIMRSLRVAAVPTVGKPFDPSMHEAIAREESQVFKEGVVMQELRRGFFLGDRLLRPAMVKVSSGPGTKKPVCRGREIHRAARFNCWSRGKIVQLHTSTDPYKRNHLVLAQILEVRIISFKGSGKIFLSLYGNCFGFKN